MHNGQEALLFGNTEWKVRFPITVTCLFCRVGADEFIAFARILKMCLTELSILR